MAESELRIQVNPKVGEVTGLLKRPRGAHAVYAFAHGAGAGMRHAFMEAASAALAERGIATLRYAFPFTEAAKRRPDSRPVLVATVKAAVAVARQKAGDRPVFAGGKSMGGRMTSLAASEEPLAGVAGLVFYGFPLHAAGKPSVERADHLAQVGVPMLFLQGTRDALADLERLGPICRRLGAKAQLHEVLGADHGFQVLKRSGRTDGEVVEELTQTVSAFIAKRS